MIYSIRSGTYSECRFEFRYCKPNNDYLTKFDNLFYGTHWTTDVSTVDSEFELAYKNGVFAMHSFDYNDVNDGAFNYIVVILIHENLVIQIDGGCTCDLNNYDKFRDIDAIGYWNSISSCYDRGDYPL